MARSLFPSDESLPTWLHTLLIIGIVSPVALYLLWFGISALVHGHLEPISGPELGQTLFGTQVLDGRKARLAGVSLCLDAAAFVGLGLRYSRFEILAGTPVTVALWMLFAMSTALAWFVFH